MQTSYRQEKKERLSTETIWRMDCNQRSQLFKASVTIALSMEELLQKPSWFSSQGLLGYTVEFKKNLTQFHNANWVGKGCAENGAEFSRGIQARNPSCEGKPKSSEEYNLRCKDNSNWNCVGTRKIPLIRLNSLSLYVSLPQSPKDTVGTWCCIGFIQYTTWQHEHATFLSGNKLVCVCVFVRVFYVCALQPTL